MKTSARSKVGANRCAKGHYENGPETDCSIPDYLQ